MIRPLHSDIPERFPKRRKRRRLRSVPMLPTLLTLGNLYFGFAAIYCCTRELEDLGRGVNATQVQTLNSVFLEARAPSFLSIAVWMIFASMVCDALDGRVARKTGQASQFGVQLDSLADNVSFGAAPALMMITLVRREIEQWGFVPFGFGRFGQMSLLFGAVYLCCAALRLARFNVEATLEEASHKGFKGLPSPGAAAAVIALVFLHEHLDITAGWHGTAKFVARILPFLTLSVALLMVSRVPYTHAVSSFLRRRPFWQIVPVMLALVLVWLYTEVVAVVIAWGFVMSGIVKWWLRRNQAAPPRAGFPVVEPEKSIPPRQAE